MIMINKQSNQGITCKTYLPPGIWPGLKAWSDDSVLGVVKKDDPEDNDPCGCPECEETRNKFYRQR